jgi:hypothetical protein
MGILLTFMFLWNMIGALVLIPSLSHFLLRNASAQGAMLKPAIAAGIASERTDKSRASVPSLEQASKSQEGKAQPENRVDARLASAEPTETANAPSQGEKYA